ncbi:hypothetical protein [Curtobacterium sp. MCBD17_023]|uniref:hypothetical protein n=1 Tax=Curtobacterium sp. MCBD17_023 TaxID=2175657 RepID=UPI000D8BAB94|nr:hypothetical protein [Curtobacterium sp. MCBD17_023]PYY50159.1 hypothetical protein DEI84_05710 [Curtobacterium sp. MCBD17_023]
MHVTNDRPPLLRAAAGDPAATRALQRGHRAGRLVRLRPGVFLDRSVWESLDPAARHLALARAVAPALPLTTAFSHQTAALVHGWPLIAPPPERVHVIDDHAMTTAHRSGIVRHAGPLPGLTPHSFDGVRVADVLATAVAIVRCTTPSVAAVALDHAVRSATLTLPELLGALPRPPEHGSRRARTVGAALDPRHESVGESFTAVRLVELGDVDVEPQHEFRHPDGGMSRVDFWLPRLGVVIEFDGRQKYRDPSMTGGADPADVLWREKLREDRIRALPEVRAVVRVTWWHLVDPDRLRALFRSHGIVLGS